MDLTPYTDINLIQDAQSLHKAIHNCPDTRKSVFYELILGELKERGYRIREEKSLKIGR